jgi:hypothetical protein
MIETPQSVITDFFVKSAEHHNNRHQYLTQWQHSGYALIKKISLDENVIDIGCGRNLFKPLLPNLIGVDPATDEADYKIPFLEFDTDQKFDVALCLGSVQFGTLDNIKEHLYKINSLLTPNGRIYWRCNGNTGTPDWFFKWTFELHQELSTEFGYTLNECKWDYYSPDHDQSYRIYAEWIRKS